MCTAKSNLGNHIECFISSASPLHRLRGVRAFRSGTSSVSRPRHSGGQCTRRPPSAAAGAAAGGGAQRPPDPSPARGARAARGAPGLRPALPPSGQPSRAATGAPSRLRRPSAAAKPPRKGRIASHRGPHAGRRRAAPAAVAGERRDLTRKVANLLGPTTLPEKGPNLVDTLKY